MSIFIKVYSVYKKCDNHISTVKILLGYGSIEMVTICNILRGLNKSCANLPRDCNQGGGKQQMA